jgi:hypothetical protein
MIAKWDITTANHQGNQGFQICFDRLLTFTKRNFIHTTHDAQILTPLIQQFSGMRTTINLKWKEAVNA